MTTRAYKLQKVYQWLGKMPDGRIVNKGSAANAIEIVLVSARSGYPDIRVPGPILRRFGRICAGVPLGPGRPAKDEFWHCIERPQDRIWIRCSDGKEFVTGPRDNQPR